MENRQSDNFLYFATATVSLVSLGTGTVYSWTSPVLPKLKSNDSSVNPLGYEISASQESQVSSLLCVGSLVGPLIASQVVDRIGRKKSLLTFVVPMVVAYLTLAFARRIELFYISRFLLGIGASCIFTVVPMYVGEIAKDTNRGLLGCFTEIFLTAGELVSVTFGSFVGIQGLCLINLVPFIIFAIVFTIFIPESPYYHIIANKEAKAEISLKKLRRTNDVKEELEGIDSFVKESLDLNRSFRDLFKSKILIRATLISIGLMFCQEMCGITVIIYYTEEIFQATGSKISANFAPIILSLFKLTFSCVSSCIIEKTGRRLLLVVSMIGTILSLTSLGLFCYLKQHALLPSEIDLSILPLFCLIFYIIFFSIGAGPLPWTLIGEIFPPDVKAVVAPIPIFFNNTYAFLGSFAFPYLIKYFGMSVTMCFFATLGFAGLLFIIFFVPETKGRSLQQIQEDLAAR